MKITVRWNRFASCTFLSLTWMFCLQSIDTGGRAAVAAMKALNTL
jgi:hypothetical protein